MTIRQPQETCCSGPVNKAMFTDPVCGTRVSAITPFTVASGGMTYYFCSTECLDSFQGALGRKDAPGDATRAPGSPASGVETSPADIGAARAPAGSGATDHATPVASAPGSPESIAGRGAASPVRARWILVTFLGIAAYFLWTEYRAHLVEFLPWVLVLGCMGVHLFMHRGHGGRHGEGPERGQ